MVLSDQVYKELIKQLVVKELRLQVKGTTLIAYELLEIKSRTPGVI